jgi:hypothetical protein
VMITNLNLLIFDKVHDSLTDFVVLVEGGIHMIAFHALQADAIQVFILVG